MFTPTDSCKSNWRAGSWLAVSLVLILGSSVPSEAAIHLTDEATGAAGQQFGAAISELEDLNADGRGEFLIGAPGDDIAGLNAGAVFYYRSRPDNSYGLQQVWRGVGGEQFGWAVARIGDVNSDGIPDFAVGAPLSDASGSDAGRVCLFWGGSTISSTPNLIITGEAAGGRFGYAISAAGDFNGDGEDDFIVGAPYQNAPGLQSGAAFVIFGGNGGPSDDLADALRLDGEVANDNFGASVSDAGNFLGTARDCVVVGAPGHDSVGMDAGAAYVFEGAAFPANPDGTYDHKITIGAATKAGSRYGFAVRGIGRWDGDGYDDVVIGAPFCDQSGSEAGRVEIVLGDPSPSATGDRYVNGEAATGHFGHALARVGDITESGADDVLIGAPGHDGVATDSGRAYIYEGGSISYNSAADLLVLTVAPLQPGTAANDQFGYAVASAGLLDTDAIPDYAVGAPGGNIGSTASAGYVWIQDSGGGVVAAALSSWEAAWTADGAVALRFALAVPMDRVASVQLERLILDSDGAVVQSTALWSGPPAAAGDPVQNLLHDGTAFLFTDTGNLPADAYTGSLEYALTVSDDQGQILALDSLAGPGLFQGTVPRPALMLDAPWPNPFNPNVSVRFQVPEQERAVCRVTDLRGRHVALLFTGTGEGAWRTVTWDGRDDTGTRAASGVYLITLETADERVVRRVVLAK